MQTLLVRSSPVIVQSILAFVLGVAIVLNTAMTDHVLHDFYVKSTIAECHSSNQEDYCMKMRQLHGVSSTAQIELGDIYWTELNRQAISIGFIMFGVRISFSIMMHYLSGSRKIRLIDIYIALLFGLTSSILFIGGFLDIGYYWVQDEPVPDKLEWLNDVGLFAHTQVFYGQKDVVDRQDLYVTALLSFAIIGLGWLVAVYWWGSQRITRMI